MLAKKELIQRSQLIEEVFAKTALKPFPLLANPARRAPFLSLSLSVPMFGGKGWGQGRFGAISAKTT